MLSSVSVAWRDIFLQHTPITLTDWSCREWRHVQQTQDDSTFGKAAGAGLEEPWKERSPFSHLCNLFQLKNRKTEATGGTCSDNHLLALQVFFRVAEKSSGVPTRRTCDDTCTRRFQLKNRQRGSPWPGSYMTATFMHCKFFLELERRHLKEATGIHAVTSTYIHR